MATVGTEAETSLRHHDLSKTVKHLNDLTEKSISKSTSVLAMSKKEWERNFELSIKGMEAGRQ